MHTTAAAAAVGATVHTNTHHEETPHVSEAWLKVLYVGPVIRVPLLRVP